MNPTEHADNTWIEQYKAGDVSALEHLVEHYRKPLYAFIYNMLQGRGDAEEIFQEVWLRVIRNLRSYRDRNFAGWLFRIAHNLFIDRIRLEQRFVAAAPASSANDETPLIERIPSPHPTPDAQTADRDLGHRIRAAIASLPDDQRAVFLMRTEADLSFKEIAAIQQTSLNTALGRMHYALQKLRPLLEEDYQQIRGGPRHET